MKMPGYEPGTFIRIPLADKSFGYGRVLELPYVAFYDFRTSEPFNDLAAIASKPVLFRQAVRASGLKRWKKLGREQLDGEVAQPIIRYMQDLGDYRKCVIFDTTGNEREATPEECVGIELAAVWEPHHIEERLLDTFMGRPNKEEVRARVRLK